MHFDAHLASEIFESGQHIGDPLCVVPGFIVAMEVLHNQNKILPRFQFQFVQCVFKLCISDELTDLRTVKDTSFQLLYG